MQLDPTKTTVGDLLHQTLKLCGKIGQGQQATDEEVQDAWTRLQWMLQLWERKRWMVYHLVTVLKISNGSMYYTVGPGGDFDTSGAFNNDFSSDFQNQKGGPRPDKIETAFLRQLTQSQPNQIDYPLTLLQSREDYTRIALKSLKSFPNTVYYDPGWPLGQLYVWPVPLANIYAVAITYKDQLPANFKTLADVLLLPFEYYQAITTNLALQLRGYYQIPSFPGDQLPAMAKDAMNTVRGANTGIAQLQMPGDLVRPGIYNIFSDQYY